MLKTIISKNTIVSEIYFPAYFVEKFVLSLQKSVEIEKHPGRADGL